MNMFRKKNNKQLRDHKVIPEKEGSLFYKEFLIKEKFRSREKG